MTEAEVQDIGSIVRSVQADIAHLKNQLESLPPFPQGKSKIIFNPFRITSTISVGSIPKSCGPYR